MLVNELLALGGAYEIIAAILAATSLTTDDRYHIATGIHLDGVTRHALHLTDEVLLVPRLVGMTSHHRLSCVARNHLIGLIFDGIGKNQGLATQYFVAIKPVHYHSVALLQLGRKPTCGH